MPEQRIDRTSFLGLLALMLTNPDQENWSFPYHNIIQTDAAFAALHDAPRVGTALFTAPSAGPTLAVTTGGGLPGGVTVEIAQTFVDEYGRETECRAGHTTGDIDRDSRSDGGRDLGDRGQGLTGYEGGLLSVWYSWIDSSYQETMVSPVDRDRGPLCLGGDGIILYDFILPTTPLAAGAFGANIYVQHRDGNIVLGYRIIVDTQDTFLSTGPSSTACGPIRSTTRPAGETLFRSPARPVRLMRSLPGSTRGSKDGSGPAGDRRCVMGGVEEWDPSTVTYPLIWSGDDSSLAPGFPPTVSQVKSIRPIDLTTEVMGTIAEAYIDQAIARDQEIAVLLGGPYILGTGLVVSQQTIPDMTVQVSSGYALSDQSIWTVSADNSVGIYTANATFPRKDIVCLNDYGAVVSSGEDVTCRGVAEAVPAAPTTPAHYVLLAVIDVPANDTTIATAQITDSRTLRPTFAQLDIDTDAHAASTTIHPPRATYTEINTGTDANKVVTPDALAASYAGTKSMVIIVVEQATDVSASSGKISFPVPPSLNGMNIVSANAMVNTAGTTNPTTVDIFNVTDSVDLLSGAISIASGETIGTPGTVDTAHDDVAANDILRVDVTTASDTYAKGLMVMLEFRLP